MRLSDHFKPKWKHSDWTVRLSAVEYATNQSVLAKVAKDDEHEGVRDEAVAKLKNQVLLAEIAKNDKNRDVRKTAAKRLKEIEKYEAAKKAGVRVAECRVCSKELYLEAPLQEGYPCQRWGWNPICAPCIGKGNRCDKCGGTVFVVMLYRSKI
jgi:hypothetical protein